MLPPVGAGQAIVMRRGAARAVTVAGAAAALVLVSVGVIGLVVEPLQLLWSVVLGAVVGGGVHLRNLGRVAGRSTMSVLCDSVVLAGLATVAICAVCTGLAVVLGTVSGPVIIMLVLASTPWALRGLHRAFPRGSAVSEEQVLRRLEPNREVPGPPVVAADLSTGELCLAWRRSYLVLIETPFGPGRDAVVSRRRELLDELERRDHAGFVRWIDTGARAASDPGRYLGTDR
jgi:hypothetical protein